MSSIDRDLLAADDPRWAEVLAAIPHDIYQTPGYAIASSVADAGVPGAALATEGRSSVLLPYVSRELGAGRWDAVSPYGYAGPVFSPDTGAALREELIQRALRAMAGHGCVSVFLRSHPGLNRHWPALDAFEVVRRSTSPTVVLDLTIAPEVLWAATASGHRYEIQRARRLGYECAIDEDFERYHDFADLYHEAMITTGAREYYLFDDDYFDALRDRLGSALILMVATKDGELASASLFTQCGEWVQYHLSATAAAHRAMAPSKLVLDEMRTQAQHAGYRWLHLGGGRGGGQDTLLDFKAGFSRGRLEFHTAGVVLDSAEYARLAAETPPGADPAYFPAYRRSG